MAIPNASFRHLPCVKSRSSCHSLSSLPRPFFLFVRSCFLVEPSRTSDPACPGQDSGGVVWVSVAFSFLSKDEARDWFTFVHEVASESKGRGVRATKNALLQLSRESDLATAEQVLSQKNMSAALYLSLEKADESVNHCDGECGNVHYCVDPISR